MSRPSIVISVYQDETTPVVFSTALRSSEQRALEAWLAENPDLQSLVENAVRLAEAEPEKVTTDAV